jgi:hypothetical protein
LHAFDIFGKYHLVDGESVPKERKRQMATTPSGPSGLLDGFEHRPIPRRLLQAVVVLLALMAAAAVVWSFWQLVNSFYALYWQHPRVAIASAVFAVGLVLMKNARRSWPRTVKNLIIGITMVDGLALLSYVVFHCTLAVSGPTAGWVASLAVTYLAAALLNYWLIAPDSETQRTSWLIVFLGSPGLILVVVAQTAGGILSDDSTYGGQMISYVWPWRD